MDLWQILVLGVLKRGLGCDFDRLHDLANNHRTVRAMLAHGDFADESRYELQTLIDNVSLLSPELLPAVGRLVVDSGHAVAGKKPGAPLRRRCDSFAVEAMVEETQAIHPELRVCSFDRGFHSPSNRARLDGMLELNVLSRKGRPSRADRARESDEAFAAARRQHPADDRNRLACPRAALPGRPTVFRADVASSSVQRRRCGRLKDAIHTRNQCEFIQFHRREQGFSGTH